MWIWDTHIIGGNSNHGAVCGVVAMHWNHNCGYGFLARMSEQGIQQGTHAIGRSSIYGAVYRFVAMHMHCGDQTQDQLHVDMGPSPKCQTGAFKICTSSKMY